MKQVNTLAVELIRKSEDAIATAKEHKKKFSFGMLMALGKEVCVIVETYTDDVGELSSQTKISLGIELLINLVDIPYIPQWLERQIYEVVLVKAVKYMENMSGKSWLGPVTEVKHRIKTEIKKSIKKKTKTFKKKDNKKVDSVRKNLKKRSM